MPQGLSIEGVVAAGLWAMSNSGSTRGHTPPDPRDISECEGLLEVYYKQVLQQSTVPCVRFQLL